MDEKMGEGTGNTLFFCAETNKHGQRGRVLPVSLWQIGKYRKTTPVIHTPSQNHLFKIEFCSLNTAVLVWQKLQGETRLSGPRLSETRFFTFLLGSGTTVSRLVMMKVNKEEESGFSFPPVEAMLDLVKRHSSVAEQTLQAKTGPRHKNSIMRLSRMKWCWCVE